MALSRRLRAYARSLSRLPRWLSHTLSLDEARAAVLDRIARREQGFLDFVRRAVFANPRSPYLPLFRAARCGYDDLARGVQSHGLDDELRSLKEAGVWISLDEFKGRAPIARDGVELRTSATDFDNPALSPIASATTGGSSGRSVRSSIDLDHLAVRATYQALIMAMMRVYGVPMSLWYPPLPASSGAVAALMYTKLGQPPVRWFDIEPGPRTLSAWQGKALTRGLVESSRRSRRPLPPLLPGSADIVLDWMLRARDAAGRCAVQSYTSRAVRLSQAARSRGESLEGAIFHVGAEPLTPARFSEIRASGADVFWRYSSTETGTIAVGCGDPDEVGDYHLCRDLVAAVQDDAGEEQSSVLYLTALNHFAPKVMINVQLGDCARVVSRPCGCMLGGMGLDTHLMQVRSIGRVTCEGMTVPVSELVRVVEEVLCPRYGGSALDYQWAEREEASGRGRLLLRIGPEVGPVEVSRVTHDVLREFARRSGSGRIVAGVWGKAGTLRVVRERPVITGRGKALPFLREGTAAG